MTVLIRFLLINLSGGAMLGMAVGCAFLKTSPPVLAENPYGAALILWALAASFGMGAICTGLAFISEE